MAFEFKKAFEKATELRSLVRKDKNELFDLFF